MDLNQKEDMHETLLEALKPIRFFKSPNEKIEALIAIDLKYNSFSLPVGENERTILHGLI